jgi:UrcA family protein
MHADTRKTGLFVTMFAMAATAGFATTASAGEDADAARHDDVVVNYSDLNLDSAAGNQKLYARLTSAAERACGSASATRDLELRAQYRACVESALNRAVDKVGSRDLRALHRTATAHHVG